jgi:hypothetical protein
MEGLKVKCTNCGRTDFITTSKYDPKVSPRGDMLKCTLPYHIDFLLSSTTPASSLTCPECCAQLAPSGRLTVVGKTIMEQEEDFQKEIESLDEVKPNVGQPAFICEVCGKELKTKLALAGHMRSHKEVKNG